MKEIRQHNTGPGIEQKVGNGFVHSLINSSQKTIDMNNGQNQQAKNNNGQLNNNKKRAENKDNLDSREGEEQLTKGDDHTNNKKETKSAKPSTSNKGDN
ncbi:MAG: hypothetical protein Q7T76_16985 [Ferruginibacter sp.]|nr:hypothetical protein [Ferruginibacter sp.]